MPELIIDESNYGDFQGDGTSIDFGGQTRILNARPRQTLYGACPEAAEGMPLIPREEWPRRIELLDKTKGWLHGLVEPVVPCMDQDGLGYCHAYGTVLAAMSARLVEGLPFVMLSAESVGGPITSWQNEGAYPENDLKQIRDVGACAAAFMDKAHSLRPKSWKSGWEADCQNHRVTEWWDLDQRGKTFDACMTSTLLGQAYAAGFGWWGHLVCGGFQARVGKGGRYEILYRNSWGKDFGENGFFWLVEGHGKDTGTPDIGAFAPRQVTASRK